MKTEAWTLILGMGVPAVVFGVFFTYAGLAFADSPEPDDPDCVGEREREDHQCYKVTYEGDCWFMWGSCEYYYWDDKPVGS